MELKYPALTIGMFILVGILFLIIRQLRKKHPAVLFIPNIGIAKTVSDVFLRKKFSRILQLTKHMAIICIIILLALLSGRPQTSRSITETRGGLDIMLTLDMSSSMFEEDYSPNRLEAATDVIDDFIKRLTNDRVGMVIFAGDTYTLCPLTFDYGILQEYLGELNPDTQYRYFYDQGTAMGEALISSSLKFQDDDERSKVIILISDGQPSNDTFDTEEAATYAKNKGIKIYTIYIGSPDDINNPDFYGVYGDGEEILAKISDITGGKMYSAKNKSALGDIFDDIQKLEKKELEVSKQKAYIDNPMPYVYALAVVSILFISSKSLLGKS